MTITYSFIKKLIKSEKPIKPIWNQLLEIWNPKNFDEVENYHETCEEKTLQFESTLDETYPSFFEKLLPSNCSPNISSLTRPIVWLDGMSIREAQWLAKEHGLKVEGPSFSVLPSETIFYREKMGIKPTKIRDYKEPTLKGNEKEIWCPIPDAHLSDVKGNDPPELKKMYEDLEKTLLKIVRRLETDSVTITSDHGYVDITRAQRSGKRAERKMKNLFENKRYTERENSDGDWLEKGGYSIEYEGRYLLRGRRHWTKRGKSCRFPHGGISLMECLVPIIRMELD